MKMSKSINDYKEAMDNIKISESFYKRTEVLLTEIPEVKIEKRSALNGRRVSAVIMSAAACVICLFGVKLAIDGRQTDIVTETVTNVGEEAGTVSETDKGADELIDDFGEYDDAGIIAESITPDVHTPASGEPVAVNPATSPDSEVTTAGTTVSETPAETKPATTSAEKRAAQGIDPDSSSANTASKPKDEVKDKEPPPMPNSGASGGISADGAEFDYDEDIMDSEEEYDEAAPTASEAQSENLFGELSLNNVTVDITPYFNMGDIKSGEGAVKRSGMELKPVLDLISSIKSEPSVVKINNGSFTSLFSIRIYDENIGLDFYSIYLTNSSTIVITKHSPDGSQVRETYTLRQEYYEPVRHQLFLLFGSENDYELFINLIGGK